MKQSTAIWLIVGVFVLVIVGSSVMSAINAMTMFGHSGALPQIFQGLAGIFGGVIVKP